jgi:hypothetical protein
LFYRKLAKAFAGCGKNRIGNREKKGGGSGAIVSSPADRTPISVLAKWRRGVWRLDSDEAPGGMGEPPTPAIAFNAADKTFTVVIDFGQRLVTLRHTT